MSSGGCRPRSWRRLEVANRKSRPILIRKTKLGLLVKCSKGRSLTKVAEYLGSGSGSGPSPPPPVVEEIDRRRILAISYGRFHPRQGVASTAFQLFAGPSRVRPSTARAMGESMADRQRRSVGRVDQRALGQSLCDGPRTWRTGARGARVRAWREFGAVPRRASRASAASERAARSVLGF